MDDKEKKECKVEQEKTHKVSVLIGNGFDIQVLNHIGVPTNTTYVSFYNFINWKYGNKIRDNLIVKKMDEDKSLGRANWSDFENTIKDIIKMEYSNKDDNEDNNVETKYRLALLELQSYFSDFLNTIVTTEVLAEVDKLGQVSEGSSESLPLVTLKSFSGDLSPEESKSLKFLDKDNIKNHDVLDFTFLNFNYTPLFDNYITLNKSDFDPHEHKKSENNFIFEKATVNKKFEKVYVKLRTRIFHPHGYQHTPRSMLFGFDNPNQVIDDYKGDLYTNEKVQAYVKYFLKPYWAENNVRYRKYLAESELYILFGHSIGESDRYWWENIANNLKNNKSELIIYNYTRNDTDDEKIRVKLNFLAAAGFAEEKDVEKILKRIFVVNFEEKKLRYAFNVDKNKLKKIT